MDFKNFRINVFFRVATLLVSMFVFASIVGRSDYFFTNLILGGIIIFQVLRLIKYIEHTNYEVINFLNAIQFDDFSNNYELSYSGKSYTDLNAAFQNVLKRFKEVRKDKEKLYEQLRLILQHLGVGIVAVRKTGEIDFMNNAAKRILRMNRLSQIAQIKNFNHKLFAAIEKLRTGEKEVVSFRVEGEMISILLHVNQMTINQKEYKLIALQNIRNELENQELEAWDKLIRVLTHELMNSLTPIASLASLAHQELDYLQENAPNLCQADFEDMGAALQTIAKRSEHLGNFVQDFRRLVALPTPQWQHLSIQKIFEETLAEFENNQEKAQIHISVQPQNLVLTADKQQIKNMLAFLLQNALEAEKNPDSPKIIHLIAQQDEKSRPQIIVRDNGTGIDEDALERVFIPFFSTKKNASGIGLSLAKIIMQAHKGSIVAKSRGGMGTDIVLQF